MSTATSNLIVFPPQREYNPTRLLTAADITDIRAMLAPVTEIMNADGMRAGGITVTAGPHGLDVSHPDRVHDHRAAAKLRFAREVLRGKLIAAGTLWQVPVSTLLCLLQPVPDYPGIYQGLAVTLFDDSPVGTLIDANGLGDAHVEALPFTD